MSDHAGPKVEGNDERQRLLCATREDALLVRDQRETDVRGQPEGARRDDVPEDRGQAMPDMALVRASMDEPGRRCSEDVAAKHLEDRHERGRDALEGRIVHQEPGREACEPEEQQDAEEPRAVRGGLPWDRRRGRGRMAPEVERDHDHDRVNEDGRHEGFLEDEGIAVRRSDDDRDRPANAPVRKSQGFGQLADGRNGHVRAPSMVRLRLTMDASIQKKEPIACVRRRSRRPSLSDSLDSWSE